MTFNADKTKPKTIDTAKHSRRGGFGKARLPSEDVREHCVSVRLNKSELTQLDSKRGGYRRGKCVSTPVLVPRTF